LALPPNRGTANPVVAVGGIADIGMRWSRKARLRMTHVGHQTDVRVRLIRHPVKRISGVAYGIGFLLLSGTNFYLNCAQQILSNFIRRLWHADKMPLTFIAIAKAEEFELFGRLYALGDDVDGKVSRKKDY
jgi:hypothetical protein